MNKRIYLDYAAATPLEPAVAQAMHDAEKIYANPSAQYASAREANTQLASARKRIAMFFGAKSEEIIFTSGASEANNLAIFGTARAFNKGHIISITTEHVSVREPLNQLAQEGFDIDLCPVDSNGRIKLVEFEKLINYDTVLVTINMASSEIGTIQPIAKLAKIIRNHEESNGTKIIFHTDASAAVQTLNCDVSRLGVDLMTISGAKIYGPKSAGALYVKRGTKLKPIIWGGHQESGLRSGSESLPLIVGLTQALEIVASRRKLDNEKYRELYVNLLHSLSGVHNLKENGHPKDRLYSLVNLSLASVNGEDLVAYLDSAGFEVATGAACEASNHQPSLVLLAIGRSKSEAQGSLRISFGRKTTHKDIDQFCDSLINTLSALK